MDNKKQPRRSTHRRKPQNRKRTKTSRKKASALKTNIVLLAILFGASAMLLTGRFLLVPPVAIEHPPDESPGREPSGTAVEKPSGEKPVRQPAPVRKPPEQPAAKPPEQPARQPTPLSPGAPPLEKPVPVEPKGTLVFVFDDAGHNLAQLQPFLELPFPCTIAVLPRLRYSAESARKIRSAGKECLLHQPMQAQNLAMDPGPGAIRKGMTPDEIRVIVRENIDEIAPVTGLNNHEGSLITADRTAMAAVFDIVSERGLYFLDSRTTSDTVAPVLARERNMQILERSVFLDNSQDRNAIMDAVYSGMKIAERRGSAIMIGHVWSNELAQILTEMYPELVSQGFSLSTIAKIAASDEGDQ
ncbi:MAG TPA: divergent polysaccharide deacetylase family protein [Treponemataceae bacterium]|nr:divergent polysaccharide deacetylase family protein [Treponemataceae bacterium]